MDLKKEFICFLDDAGVFDQFIYNLSLSDISCSNDFDEYVENCQPDESFFINCAFKWGETNEGYSFWEALDISWADYVEYFEL